MKVLSQFEFYYNVSFVTMWDFEFCYNLSFWFWSLFEVLSLFEFAHNLIFFISWVFEFSHNFSFWALSQFEFLVVSQFNLRTKHCENCKTLHIGSQIALSKGTDKVKKIFLFAVVTGVTVAVCAVECFRKDTFWKLSKLNTPYNF